MSYLLDSDICIFFLQGKYDLNTKIEKAGIQNCFISEITVAELKYGAFYSDDPAKHLKQVGALEELFIVLPIYPILDQYGSEKAKLRKSGNLISDFDLLIGVTSIGNKMTLVTNNEKHLDRIEGIIIENWID